MRFCWLAVSATARASAFGDALHCHAGILAGVASGYNIV